MFFLIMHNLVLYCNVYRYLQQPTNTELDGRFFYDEVASFESVTTEPHDHHFHTKK